MRKYFHYEGKKIFYREEGEGDVIVLVHGYLETSEVFRNFSSRLSGYFRVITPDLPGHGSSDLFGPVSTMDFMADIIKELLKAKSVEKCFLAGHSMGGYITLAFAEKYPSYLKGFSLMHSHPFADSSEQRRGREHEIVLASTGRKHLFYPEKIRSLFAPFNLETMRDKVDASEKIASQISNSAISAVLHGMMKRQQLLHVIEGTGVPFLWILGRWDNLIAADKMKGAVKLNALSRLVILEKSGHLGFIEEEEETIKAIASFMQEMY